MRTRLVILASSLLAACVSGTRVVYVPVPASTTSTPAPVAKTAPAPRPLPPPPMPPVSVTIARVEDSRLLVSTNQPAFLAVFEIVPDRGVALVYPASPRQRQVALAGSNWVTVAPWLRRDDDDRYARDERRSRYDRASREDRRRPMERHVYAIASDRPLRLTDDAFNEDYLRNVVGTRAYRDDEPYEAMTALARRFVPPGKDEQWGEDLYTMDIARPSVTVRVAKIYCADGSIIYVRDEMADRASCPWRGRPAARPDSVIASNGRPMGRPIDPRVTQPLIFRVPRPVDAPVVEQQGGRAGQPDPIPTDRVGGRPVKADSTRDGGNDHHDNGNHYGWDKGNHGNNGNNGNDNAAADPHGKSHAADRPDVSDERPKRPSPTPEVQLPEREHPSHGAPESKPDVKADAKPEAKPEQKPAAQPETKAEGKAEPELGVHGLMSRARAKMKVAVPDSASATPAAADSSSDAKGRKDKTKP